MKALILSDSHGNFQSITDIVESEKNISLIIFAGDIQRDADDIETAYPDIRFEYVLGNNDYFVHSVPFDKIFEFENKRIFLTHGHMYRVKSSMHSLYKKACDVKADICIFGHTHVSLIEQINNITLLNPGSASKTYAVLEIDAFGNMHAEIKNRKINKKG